MSYQEQIMCVYYPLNLFRNARSFENWGIFLKQLFFEIEVNSGRIFAEPRSDEVNILPLFTEIEKNNCFSIYTGSDLNNIFRRKPLKIDLIFLSIYAFTPPILFLFGLRIIHSVGGEQCSLARDSEPFRLLNTPRSLSVYILISHITRRLF